LTDNMDAKIANKLLAYDSLLLMDIMRRPGDILHKALAAGSNQIQLATKFLTPNFSIDILIKVLPPSGPDSLPGGSWWQSGLGTHIGDTLSVVVVVELGGEENILLASPPSWRRVHHATLEPGRAC